MGVSVTHQFKGYDIPVDLMNLTGGGPDWFDASSANHIAVLQKHIGLKPQFAVMEVGCGIGRDAIPLTEILSADAGGVYIGTDIIAESIAWCQSNIQARNPNFAFHHMNIQDQLYNPAGTLRNLDAVLPAPRGSVDRIIAQSVFTHMLQADIEHYLAEFRRVLKPGGLAFATVFIYDDAILENARATNLTTYNLRFDYQVSDCCRVNHENAPTTAVAYTREGLDRMVSSAGLRHIRSPLRGGWSGFFPETEDGQDALVLTTVCDRSHECVKA